MKPPAVTLATLTRVKRVWTTTLCCDQSDATQFLADCKQYMTSVSNSMYACGAEGSLGGIPQWTPACNIDC